MYFLRNIFGVLLQYGNVNKNTSWCSYLYGGQEWLGFSFWIEIDFVFVRGSDLTWFLCDVENDLVLVFGSKLARFMWGIEHDLISE